MSRSLSATLLLRFVVGVDLLCMHTCMCCMLFLIPFLLQGIAQEIEANEIIARQERELEVMHFVVAAVAFV